MIASILYNNEVKKNESKYVKNSFLRKIVLVFLMFMFIYPFSVIPSIDTLTSTRVASIVIFLWGFFSQEKLFIIQIGNKNSEKSFRHYLLVNFLLLLYTLFLLFFWGKGTGKTVTNIFINILTFSLAFYYGSKYVFFDAEEFLSIILYATLLQSCVIFVSLLNNGFYTWIRTMFYANSYFEITGKLGSMRGYALGIGCFTSKGSQKMSLGIVACVYFILNKNRASRYLFYMLLITLASTAVARTGAVYTVVALAILLITAIQKEPKKAKGVFVKIVLGLLITVGIIFIFGLKDLLGNVFWRLLSLLKGGLGSFFSSYFKGNETVIPGISFETLIGTGIWSGASGCGLQINADGGFFRSYFALGLVTAILYYLFFLFNYLFGIKNISYLNKTTCSLLFYFILIGEFKEPLLFDWYYQTLLFVYIYLCENVKTVKNSIITSL